jgi:hypothetical protein
MPAELAAPTLIRTQSFWAESGEMDRIKKSGIQRISKRRFFFGIFFSLIVV